jgi:BMFP domain-containing protein YqiC
MKPLNTHHYLVIFTLIAGLGITAPAHCAASDNTTSAEDIKQETVELLQALKSYSVEQRDKAIAQARTALDNLDNRIDTLEADMLEQWDDMDQAARAKTRASLQALRQQRTRVAELFGRLQSSSTSAWAQIKQGFSSAYEELRGAWESSEREISSEQRK